jgi:glycosyltransferase involved in cell wall biosynthesis
MRDQRLRSRPRLNWFSPLRPAETEIAHYAARTLPQLARHADVIVWTEASYWPPDLESHAQVRRWDGESWAELNAADATLYHIGNNVLFHEWIWNVACRHPGIVVLHDTVLHEFFTSLLLDSTGGEAAYLDAVRRCHGAVALRSAQRMLRGEFTADALAIDIPLTRLALERARGAVVHTSAGFEQVAGYDLCSVLQLDLPYEAGSPGSPRERDGLLRLVVFGYLAANRRIDALLQAIATFSDRHRLRLDILGHHQDPEMLHARVSDLGLKDVVRVRGFVSDSELDEALDRANLAINLRYPTMGEASASQLRIWSRSLASIVTRVGWYAELPAETVWWVNPAREIEDLHAHFRTALDSPDVLDVMGAAGRRLLETRHDPLTYGRELVAGVERVMRTPASIAGHVVDSIARIADTGGFSPSARATVARRTAEELSRWVGGPVSPD